MEQPLHTPPPEKDDGIGGWIVFFLIFVVGNIITYNSCGIVILPIPRR